MPRSIARTSRAVKSTSPRRRAPRETTPETKPAPAARLDTWTYQNLVNLLLDVRGRIDDIEFALEDTAKEDGAFCPEANREDGRAAAYEARQNIRAVERELESLVRCA